MKPRFHLRINGMQTAHMKVRRTLVDGMPIGVRQLVVTDMAIKDEDGNEFPLGPFPVDESCLIETKDMTTPEELRRYMPNGGWKQVSLSELFSMFQATGAIS